MTNGQNPTNARKEVPISRRGFVRAAAAITIGTAREGISAPAAGVAKATHEELSAAVQMQCLRPAQLEKALRDFPVVCVL